MKVHRYRPNFFEGFESKDDDKEFNTKEELLAIRWIKSWSRLPAKGDTFSGYYISGDKLMATFNYNTDKEPSWYVIAILGDKESLETTSSWFPKWKDPEYVMKNNDVIDVQSWCGDKITYYKNGNRKELFNGTQTWMRENMLRNQLPRKVFI